MKKRRNERKTTTSHTMLCRRQSQIEKTSSTNTFTQMKRWEKNTDVQTHHHTVCESTLSRLSHVITHTMTRVCLFVHV